MMLLKVGGTIYALKSLGVTNNGMTNGTSDLVVFYYKFTIVLYLI